MTVSSHDVMVLTPNLWRFAEGAGQRSKTPPADAGLFRRWQEESGEQVFPFVEAPLEQGPTPDLIARKIREAMDLADVGQLELARRTGMPRQQVSEYQHGKVAPKLPNLRRIALALGQPLEFFWTE